MFRFLARRLLLTIPVFFGVATVVFLLIHLIPGDPVQAMLGESAAPADVAVLRGRLGLDRPLIVQYGTFLEGLVTGDLGMSLRTNQAVVSALAGAAKITSPAPSVTLSRTPRPALPISPP